MSTSDLTVHVAMVQGGAVFCPVQMTGTDAVVVLVHLGLNLTVG